MSSTREPFIARHPIIAGLIALAVIVAVSVGAWAFRVVTSDAKGRGDAVAAKNSGQNRTAAQERMNVLYQDVIAADRRLDVLRDAAAAAPDDIPTQTNYRGAQTYCISAVSAYDAEARKYSVKDFVDADLPLSIDAGDPATDCQPNPQPKN